MFVPLLIVLGVKLAGAALTYYTLNMGSSGTFWTDPTRVFNLDQNKLLLENANGTPNWAYTFVGWDSAWYLSIMMRGYSFSPQSFVFSPLLPLLGRAFNLIFQNPVASLSVCSLIFGVLWIPFYQLVAEKYISKQAALGSALMFALSPYVFLFTTVAYSEGLFLFFTLGAWYLFLRGKVAIASSLAAISALTRISGAVLVLPMLIVTLREKSTQRIRRIAFSLLPLLALLSWLSYCQLTANDFFAFMHVTEWSSLYTFRTLIFDGLRQNGFSVFDTLLPVPHQWLAPFAVVAALAVPPFLIYKVAKTEKPHAIYSSLCFVWLLMFGALMSMPRYVSVLFPLWIPLTGTLTYNKKSIAFLALLSLASFLVSLTLWIDFLSGKFVA